MDERIAGTIAGAVATVPMTAAMYALHRGLSEESGRQMPYRVVTENAAVQAGAQPAVAAVEESSREGMSLTAHFGFGASAGAGYSAFAGKTGLPPVAEGALYGLAVWGGSYLGLMPALGVHRPITDETSGRNMMLIAGHLVWGAALGLVWHKLTSSGRRRRT